jgi:hypothetical protein
MWPWRNSSEILSFARLTGADGLHNVGWVRGVAMSKFAPSIARHGRDGFVLRLNELLALVVSLVIMGAIAVAAFVACAVLQ